MSLESEIAFLRERLSRLHTAVSGGRPTETCLRLWSTFIRARDSHRCVDCHNTRKLSAHHICRKSFLTEARFQTGNGITLCRNCHRKVHCGFNGRPDLQLPMDAQGGEKIDTMERLYALLWQDARDRGLPHEFYFLSDSVLARFKMFQGYDPEIEFPGSRVEQAYLIWRVEPLHSMRAMLEANGFGLPPEPVLPGTTLLFFDDERADREPEARQEGRAERRRVSFGG